MLKYILSILLTLTTSTFANDSLIHHHVLATVNPEKCHLQVLDEITIPAKQVKPVLYFLLNSELSVESKTPGVKIKLEKSEIKAKDFGMDQEDFEKSSTISQNKYSITFNNGVTGDAKFLVKFSGKIHHPIKQVGEEYARGFSQTPGLIDEKGVYLAGSTYWIPWFNDKLITFDLTITIPEDWDVVSQGKRMVHKKKGDIRITRWDSPEPMEEIFLIAAKFHEYIKNIGAVDVMAFLRTPDENLAHKYLETTAQYLEMYRKLVGPFPFSKFALVENFWETGYGMPSFTLLGEKVIRFPFILHSSYPHELLHNWWGNSAYLDFKTGNWCEGITVYMADHLIKEQRGQGAQYRQSTLQKYTDYVNPTNDFPVSKFIARHSAATEAVGYGKCMMTMHMLRQQVGDDLFIKGFQKFYRDNKFKFASFKDIRQAFEAVTGKDFQQFFQQWIERTGAPELRLSNVDVKQDQKDFSLQFTLTQIQEDETYNLDIPAVISFEQNIKFKKLEMTQKEQTYTIVFSERPLFLRIDPQFDVFRSLHYNEIHPSLSKIFGAEQILFLLPSKADKTELENYQQLAKTWSKDPSKKIEIKLDSEVTEMPADRAVWIFGRENSFKSIIEKGIKDYDAQINDKNVRFAKTTLAADKNSFIVCVRHPKNNNSVVVWLTIENKDAVAGLSRKLPHYGKYSYLAFEGSEPTNIAKGQWSAVHSPLNVDLSKMVGKSPEKIAMDLPKRKPLARLAPVFSADRMMGYINFLASDELKGRGLGTAGIEKAANFIVEQFKKAGLKPGADDGSYFQTWEDVVDEKSNKAPIKNIVGFIPGTNKNMAGESVVVSAHYDHLGFGWPDVRKGNKGKIHYGADDNASGIAVMMELANLLGKSFKPQRTVIFIAFTAEENGLVGSRHYVQNSKRFPAKKIIGALNLDTVGRLDENKLLVLNSSSAREWKFIFMGAGYVSGVEAEMVTQELDASDQVSFIEAGIPAVQFFSGAHRDYHRPTDTADKIDAAGLVKVATFVREGILYLAEREEPLSFKGQDKKAAKKGMKKGERRVSTGTMPDFSFSGEGVRIGGLSQDSPAAKAGLQKGDVIIKLGENKITNLRDYSNALKSFNPGDEVKLVYERDGEQISTTIKLAAR